MMNRLLHVKINLSVKPDYQAEEKIRIHPGEVKRLMDFDVFLLDIIYYETFSGQIVVDPYGQVKGKRCQVQFHGPELNMVSETLWQKVKRYISKKPPEIFYYHSGLPLCGNWKYRTVTDIGEDDLFLEQKTKCTSKLKWFIPERYYRGPDAIPVKMNGSSELLIPLDIPIFYAAMQSWMAPWDCLSQWLDLCQEYNEALGMYLTGETDGFKHLLLGMTHDIHYDKDQEFTSEFTVAELGNLDEFRYKFKNIRRNGVF